MEEKILKAIILTSMITVGVILTVVGDVFLKKSGGSNWWYIGIGVVTYALVAIPVAIAFKYTEFGKLFLIWESIVIIFGMALASWYFKEPFTSPKFVSLILALAALYFSYL